MRSELRKAIAVWFIILAMKAFPKKDKKETRLFMNWISQMPKF